MVSLNDLTGAFSDYIVRPANAFGLGGFVFDIEGETTINLRTEITDHYLEDNTTVQDHIAVKPKKVTLKSYVGELVYRPDGNEPSFVEKTVRKLTVLNGYLPELTTAAQSLKDINTESFSGFADSVGDTLSENLSSLTLDKATNYFSLAKNIINSDSKQQQAYQYFKSLMEQKVLMSLQTPFEYINNMAIESIVAYQGEDSSFISDFTITLKEIRTVELLNADVGASQYTTKDALGDIFQGRSSIQNAITENIGNVGGAIADYALTDIGLPSRLVDPLEFLQTEEDRQGYLKNQQDGSNPVINWNKAGVVPEEPR